MNSIIYLFIFLFGSVIGSFLNVVICRLETGEGIVKKRSHCPRCGCPLAWHDLIPIFSFIVLRGRCRNCKKPISWQYPLVETVAGLLFVLTVASIFPEFARFPEFFGVVQVERSKVLAFDFSVVNIMGMSYFLYLMSSFLVIFVYDLRHYIIPDAVLFPAIGVSFLWRGFESFFASNEIMGIIGHFSPYLFSAFGASAFFLAIILITRGKGMGLGDAKLAFLMGFLLGWPNVLMSLFFAFLVGATTGVGLIFLGAKTMKSQIPFGPFLIASTIFVLFFGEFFWGIYSSLLGF